MDALVRGAAGRRGALAVAAALASAAAWGLGRQTPEELQSECLNRLKQYSLGILMYVQDYDEQYPPMKTAAPLKSRINPYVKNANVFTCPASGVDYLPNPALNYVTLNKVRAPAELMMLRDAKPHRTPSGEPGWNVAFADGHTRLLAAEPPLGKPAPSPPPLTRAQQIRRELETLRGERARLDDRIRKLEREQRGLRRR